MSSEALARLERDLAETLRRQTYRRIDYFQPYPKQQEFFDLGAYIRERLLMAGNQVGKSFCGSAETTYHLTGEYPDNWIGKRFNRPIRGWAVGETSIVTRDVQQKLLCGEPGVVDAFGAGMIPREAFIDKPSLARGVTDAYDTIQVKHLAPDGASVDGISVLRFKSYEQGRTKMQGESIDWFWCDEEPDEDIYSEILTRTNATKGIGILTFTPLKGMSKVVTKFISEPSPDRRVVTMTIDDALHYTDEERARIVAGYPEHEREARRNGVPMLGSGLIYQVADSQYTEPTLEYVPEHWTKLWSIDFGIGHPFAAVLIAWDRDLDILHVLHCIKMTGGQPLQHATAIKAIAAAVPVSWPHDGTQREKGSGETLASLYRRQGLLMLPTHNTWPDGGYSVEAGILEIDNRLRDGRLKVGAHLSQWMEERRLYHRKNGLIVKENDDLMDATRGGVMMRRFGRPVLLGNKAPQRRKQPIADGVDFDVFTA